MIYRHRFFVLNSDSQIVLDVRGDELHIVGDMYTLLLALCEKKQLSLEEVDDLLGFDRNYQGSKIDEDIANINHAIGREVVRLEQAEDELLEEKTTISLQGELIKEDKN